MNRVVTPLRRRLLLAALVLVLAAGCIFNHVAVQPVARSSDSLTVNTPVKAHLLDGSVVVYAGGVTVARDTLWGRGGRYGLDLGYRDTVVRMPLDSVLAMESYRTAVNGPLTFVVSTVAAAATTLGTVVLLKAIFGSCPTVYADSAGTAVLQAESFSYSIAPLFEARDVDRLRVAADSDGVVRLELRNEALETHYLNAAALLEVRHDADEFVVPDARGRPLAVTDAAAPSRAVDRAGRDLRATLRAADGDIFRTAAGRLAAVGPGDLDDAIDLTFAAPRDADSVALVLRLRNSLLNTVLLYDQMLAARGARSLDWMGRDLERIGDAVELGQWYHHAMGMRVAVWRDGAFAPAGYLPDVGPIAWKDVAAVLPVPPGADTLRVRLTFVADDWRIDRVALARAWRRPAVRVVPLAAVRDADGRDLPQATASLDSADGRYFETRPGQRFTLEFRPGPATAPRTFLLAAQGYYIEWVRGAWIAVGRDSSRFTPGEPSLLAALRRWRAEQETFEARFAASRVPVR